MAQEREGPTVSISPEIELRLIEMLSGSPDLHEVLDSAFDAGAKAGWQQGWQRTHAVNRLPSPEAPASAVSMTLRVTTDSGEVRVYDVVPADEYLRLLSAAVRVQDLSARFESTERRVVALTSGFRALFEHVLAGPNRHSPRTNGLYARLACAIMDEMRVAKLLSSDDEERALANSQKPG